MIFYNFVQYLRDQFPAETIYVSVRQKLATQESVPDRNILVRATGGINQPWFHFNQPTIQVITRDVDSPNALEMANNIFEDLQTRIGLLLPAITVNGILYPAVQTAQISAIQSPSIIGVDDNGRVEYTTNYQIYLRE